MIFMPLPGERITLPFMAASILRLALYRTTRRKVGRA
jgi:hypothetical protein